MSTVITVACIALLAYGVYHYLPPDRPRRIFLLEQFRPAAPLAGILDEGDHTDPKNGDDPRPTTSAALGQSSISKLDWTLTELPTETGSSEASPPETVESLR